MGCASGSSLSARHPISSQGKPSPSRLPVDLIAGTQEFQLIRENELRTGNEPYAAPRRRRDDIEIAESLAGQRLDMRGPPFWLAADPLARLRH